MDTRISGYKFDEKQGPHKLLTNYKTEKKKGTVTVEKHNGYH